MRWYLIDRFLVFESGRRAVAIKSITAADEALQGYFPAFPVYPHALVVEGLAQTGGLLVAEANQFDEHVVLAKIVRAVFHEIVRPGDVLTFEAEIEDLKAGGAVVAGTSRLGQRLQGEVELIFAHLDERFAGTQLFEPADFLRMIRVLGMYDIGRDQHGAPLQPPPRLLAAENAENAANPLP